MNLQEMLQKRATLIDKQKSIVASAKGGISEDEKKEFDALQAEIEQLNTAIEMQKTIAGNEANTPASGSVFNGGGPGIVVDPVKEGDKDNGGFKSLGEVLHAIKYGDKKGRLEHLKAQSTTDGASGGYLVPELFSDELLTIGAKQSLIRPHAFVIPAGDFPDAKMNMPALDYSAGQDGGVSVAWIDEGAEKPETGASFRNVELQPKEVAAFITVNDTLLRNAPAASAIFGQLLTNAIVRAEDRAFINGNGDGKPLGYATADNKGRLVVTRKTANQVSTDDIANMMGAFPAEDLGEAVFIANTTTLPSLIKLQDASGRFIFIQGDLTKGVPSTLMGLPLFLTGMNAPVGQTGDIQLVNLKKYLIKDGSGIYVAMSEHVKFTSNQTVIKAFRNVDGKPWVNAPYILEGGATQVSPYVILGATTAATTPVSNLSGDATGNTVALSWTAPTGADAINVLRSDDGVTFNRINLVTLAGTAASYSDANVPDGSYSYKIVVYGGTNAGVSNAASVTVPGEE